MQVAASLALLTGVAAVPLDNTVTFQQELGVSDNLNAGSLSALELSLAPQLADRLDYDISSVDIVATPAGHTAARRRMQVGSTLTITYVVRCGANCASVTATLNNIASDPDAGAAHAASLIAAVNAAAVASGFSSEAVVSTPAEVAATLTVPDTVSIDIGGILPPGIPPPPPAEACTFEFRDTAVSVSAAEDSCLTDGGFLASIHSQAEQDLVASFVTDRAWIGYHDREQEAGCTDERHEGIGGNIEALTFVWMDGTPSDYENWSAGEPNDWHTGTGGARCDGTGHEDCTEIMASRNMQWNDAVCDNARPFVCRFCGAACEPVDFAIYDESRNAAQAEDECLRKGGHLASVHSDSDRDLIQALIQGAGTGNVWIGFHDRAQEAGCTATDRNQGNGGANEVNFDHADHSAARASGALANEFLWTDATDNSYNNWASGEPNDWACVSGSCSARCDGTGEEDCTEVWGRDEGAGSFSTWNDARCENTRAYVCGFCEGQMPPPPPPVQLDAGTGEVGTASATLDALTVELRGAYTNPVILIGTPTSNGAEEMVIRITRVRDNNFDVYVDVPHTCDSAFAETETFGWMIVEDGGIGAMQAGLTTGGLCAGGSLCTAALGCPSCDHQTGLDWFDIAFDSPIADAVAFTQIQTHTGGHWCKTRQRSVSSTGLQARLEEDGSDGGHNTEIFGWFALSGGAGDLGGSTYEALATPNAVTHQPYDGTFSATFGNAPAFFSAMQTYNGGDPAHTRLGDPVSRSGFSVFIEEETCSDSELNHIAETVGVLAVAPGNMGGAGGPILEVGSASADLSAIRITFTGAYQKPIIVAGIPTHNGDEETAIRIQSHPRRMCGLPKPNTDAGETQMPDDAVAPAGCRNGAGDGSYFDLYADIPNHAAGQGAVCGGNNREIEDFSWLITEEGDFNGLQAGHVLSKCGGGVLCPSGGVHCDGFDWIQADF